MERRAALKSHVSALKFPGSVHWPWTVKVAGQPPLPLVRSWPGSSTGENGLVKESGPKSLLPRASKIARLVATVKKHCTLLRLVLSQFVALMAGVKLVLELAR